MRNLVRGLRARMWVVFGGVERFLICEDGQDMVEYALVLGLVAMGSVATLQGLATSIGTGLANIGTHLTAFTS